MPLKISLYKLIIRLNLIMRGCDVIHKEVMFSSQILNELPRTLISQLFRKTFKFLDSLSQSLSTSVINE